MSLILLPFSCYTYRRQIVKAFGSILCIYPVNKLPFSFLPLGYRDRMRTKRSVQIYIDQYVHFSVYFISIVCQLHETFNSLVFTNAYIARNWKIVKLFAKLVYIYFCLFSNNIWLFQRKIENSIYFQFHGLI